jgi:hypothetical protein
VERAGDADRLGSEVDGHRLGFLAYDAADAVRVVRDPIVEGELLDVWLGLRLEGTARVMSALGRGSFCHLLQVCAFEAVVSTQASRS